MYWLTFVTASLVFVRGFQQLNVIGGHYIMASVTSYVIALFEVLFIVDVVSRGFDSILFVGTGGAIGVIAAMFLHPRIKRIIDNV